MSLGITEEQKEEFGDVMAKNCKMCGGTKQVAGETAPSFGVFLAPGLSVTYKPCPCQLAVRAAIYLSEGNFDHDLLLDYTTHKWTPQIDDYRRDRTKMVTNPGFIQTAIYGGTLVSRLATHLAADHLLYWKEPDHFKSQAKYGQWRQIFKKFVKESWFNESSWLKLPVPMTIEDEDVTYENVPFLVIDQISFDDVAVGIKTYPGDNIAQAARGYLVDLLEERRRRKLPTILGLSMPWEDFQKEFGFVRSFLKLEVGNG